MNKSYVDEIKKVKEHINDVFPHSNKIDIRIEEDPKQGFKSLIKVHSSLIKSIVAQKVDRDLKRSLEKSHQAVIRQIHKAKAKTSNKIKRRGKYEADVYELMDLSA